jgi:hypothetical protein
MRTPEYAPNTNTTTGLTTGYPRGIRPPSV